MNIIDLVFPKLCVNCGYPGQYVCKRCRAHQLQPYAVHKCHVCRHLARKYLVHTNCRDATHLDGVIVGYVYNDLIEKLIADVKYHFYYDILNELAELLFQQAGELVSQLGQGSVITWVPLSGYKQRWRGFNQAALLGRRMAQLLNVPAMPLLQRVENTRTQVGKSKDERAQNLTHAFRVDAKQVIPRKVIIVDDVMTTGTTLEQCAKQLKSAGVVEVLGLVLARGASPPLDLSASAADIEIEDTSIHTA